MSYSVLPRAGLLRLLRGESLQPGGTSFPPREVVKMSVRRLSETSVAGICPFCRYEHMHEASGRGPDLGSQMAGCVRGDVPYSVTGWYRLILEP